MTSCPLPEGDYIFTPVSRERLDADTGSLSRVKWSSETGAVELISLLIPFAPVAMGRPRVAVRNGKAHGYNPRKTDEAVRRIREHVVAHIPEAFHRVGGPVTITAAVWLDMPRSIPKKRQATAMPTTRPDLDNYVKTLLDGLSPLWRDDAQVVEMNVRKAYLRGEHPWPCWEVRVCPLGSTEEQRAGR